jgi:hypothetical protein
MLARHVDAAAHYDEAAAVCDAADIDWGTAPIALARADFHLAQDDVAAATAHLSTALAAFGEAGEPHQVDEALLLVARLTRQTALPEIACRTLAFVDWWRQSDERELNRLWHMARVHEDIAEELRGQLRSELGPEDYAAAREFGRRMSVDDAMALARQQVGV